MVYTQVWIFLSLLTLSLSVYVSNLDLACIKCICQASTGCNKRHNCSQGFCGPFFISKIYWEEAGSIPLSSSSRYPQDDFETCVKNFDCASKVVSAYMAKKGRDCNGDGVTDCDDYARIHFLGEENCSKRVEAAFFDQYSDCMPPRALEKLRGKRSVSLSRN